MKISDFKQLIIKNIEQGDISLDNMRVIQKADTRGLKGLGKVYAKFHAKNNTGNVKTVVIGEKSVSFSIFPDDANRGLTIDDLLIWAKTEHQYDNKTLCYLNNANHNIVVEKVNFKNIQGNVIIELETKI